MVKHQRYLGGGAGTRPHLIQSDVERSCSGERSCIGIDQKQDAQEKMPLHQIASTKESIESILKITQILCSRFYSTLKAKDRVPGMPLLGQIDF